MINNPLFSVIVPVYNGEQFIQACVQSVLSQTEADFELLIVDDGSTDNTDAILEKLAAKDIRIQVFHQENKGHTGARNTGLQNASGKYVLFLDSDDSLEQDVLKRCRESFQSTSADLVIFGICQRTLTQIKQFHNLVPDGCYDLHDPNNVIIPKLLMSNEGDFTFPKSLSAKAFRKELITPCQLNVPTEILMGEDGLCFIHAMLLAKTVCVISDVNYLYDVRSDSISYIGDRLAFQRFRVLLNCYRDRIVPLNPSIQEQFDRFVVTQAHTATRFMFRSGCDRKYFREQWREFTSPKYIKDALKNARFTAKSKQGKKMRLKHFLLRHELFWLSKLLLK